MSVANIAIAAVFTLLALFSKYAIDAAQKAAEVSAMNQCVVSDVKADRGAGKGRPIL